MFPSFLLNRVYIPKSLKNQSSGFEFTLKNVIDTGNLGGLVSLKVDGVDVPLCAVTVKTPLVEKRAEDISPRDCMPVRFNAEVVIRVSDYPLAAGKHQIVLAAAVLEAGRIDFKIEDEI